MTTNIRRQSGGNRAFTLTELLVVIAVLILLATVALPALERSNEPARQIQCAGNLRQIGVAMNIYCGEANDYVPICGWANLPIGGLPWQTYQVCRCSDWGSTNYNLGFENLGLLSRTKIILDAKIFYCPSTSLIADIFSYSYYTNAPTGWPASPTNSTINPYILAGYNYYPQLRATEQLSTVYGGGVVILPKLTSTRVQLEFGPLLNLPTPAKLSAIDPKKSITTDLLENWSLLSHQEYGSPAGVNALFPDGHAAFQTVRNHNTKGSLQPFDPKIWGSGPPYNVVGNDPTGFRIIMNGFQP